VYSVALLYLTFSITEDSYCTNICTLFLVGSEVRSFSPVSGHLAETTRFLDSLV